MPLSRNLGTLTSWNPLGLSRPVTGLLYLYLVVHSTAPSILVTLKNISVRDLISGPPVICQRRRKYENHISHISVASETRNFLFVFVIEKNNRVQDSGPNCNI